MTAATSTSSRAPAEPVGDWRHRAACLDEDPELFQPVTDAGPVFEDQVAAAKAVCGRCPVRAECLVFALAMLPFGIAGGRTEQERREDRARSGGPGRERRPPRRPASATPVEVAAAGRAAIEAGADVREVMREFRVSTRTATRWAAQTRTTSGTSASEGSHGGNRAPLGISQQCNAQAGTRTTEGPDPK